MKMARKKKVEYPEVRIEVYVSGQEYGVYLKDYIANLQKVLDSVPQEYQERTKISIEADRDTWDNDIYSQTRVYYERPMNDDERLEYDQRLVKKANSERIRDEKLFEQLKKKLGKK